MISWFKKHFIPHDGNDHRPHFLRKENIRNVLFVILFLEIFTFLIPTLTRINMTGGMAAVLPAILSNLTNEERESQNLSTLTTNPILNKAAEMKAEDMATKGYFAHTSPEGKTPWYWLSQVGYEYQYAGENLAINFSDSKDVTNAWMTSPSHKANIVKENYTEIGTGIATGVYEGRETIFVAQVYANPLEEIETQIQTNKNENPKTEIEPKVAIGDIIAEPLNILGAETNTPNADTQINQIKEATFWQKAFASPRNTTNTILYIIFKIIAIVLILYIFIKMKNHHKGLLTNGLIILAIIGAILIANYYVSRSNMVITQSLDYSNEIK